MNLQQLLFRNRFLGLKNTRSARGVLQTLIFLFFGSLVLVSIFAGTWFLLHKLDTLNSRDQYGTIINLANQWISVGDLIKERLLSMVTMAIFFMLLFSNIISSLSHLFASKDTELLLQSPVSHETIFRARFVESAVSSSWMSLFFFGPVLGAYCLNYKSGFFSILPFFPAMIPFLIIPATISTIFTMILSRYFPIHQTRKIFQFLSVFFLTIMILLIRMLQPEKLFSIQNHTQIRQFIENLQIPLFQYLPSSWLSKIGISLLSGQPKPGIEPAIFLFLSAAILILLLYFLGSKLWYSCWVRSQEIRSPQILSANAPIFTLPSFFQDHLRAIYKKDLLLFIRNPELWSQLFLIFSMVALYLYNIHLLHLDKISLQLHSVSRFVSILNVAFVGFITTSIAMRFLFPSISLEGRAFWILKTSPFPVEKLIRYKFIFYLPWIFVIGNLMTLLANWILKIPFELYLLNAFNISVICIVNSLLAVTLGTIFPNYKAENINKIFMSFGGTFFMLSSLSFMVIWFLCQAPSIWLWYVIHLRNFHPGIKHWGIAIFSQILGFFFLWVFTWLPYKKAVQTIRSEGEDLI